MGIEILDAKKNIASQPQKCLVNEVGGVRIPRFISAYKDLTAEERQTFEKFQKKK